MGRIRTETLIAAPPERVFDAARDIDLHVLSQEGSRERAVAGVTQGLIGPGEEVTFEARHFGLRLQHHARMVEFDRPRRFVDAMVRGAFASFVHEHLFEATPEGTRMIDTIDLRAPLGPLGRLAEWLFLDRYLLRLLRGRVEGIKAVCERTAERPD